MSRVPLVRVEGKDFLEGYPSLKSGPFARLEPLRVESRSDIARAAEKAFGLGDCLYFYAGLAHPLFGPAVLVYEPEWSEGSSGNVTPFDTGGFHLARILVHGVSTEDERRRYHDEQMRPTAGWIALFSQFVARYYPSTAEYVRKTRPSSDEGRGRHIVNKDERAWMWEVRVHSDHPLLAELRNAYLEFDYGEEVRTHMRSLPDAERRRLLDLFNRNVVLQVASGESPHTTALEAMAAACP